MDIGITILSEVKPSQHCSEAVKNVSKLESADESLLINRKKVMLKLYNWIDQLHLEYCLQCWSPYYRRHRKIAKMILRLIYFMNKGIKKQTYSAYQNEEWQEI